MSGHLLRRMVRRTDRQGIKPADNYVYLIDGGWAVKIGVAKDPAKRLRLLQTGSAEQLQLVAAIPGTAELERELHELFSGDRVRGEWFVPSFELLSFFEERM